MVWQHEAQSGFSNQKLKVFCALVYVEMKKCINRDSRFWFGCSCIIKANLTVGEGMQGNVICLGAVAVT